MMCADCGCARDDFDKMTERYKKLIFDFGKDCKCVPEDFEMAETEEGLYFTDIDYNLPAPSNWPARRHLDRLRDMMRYGGEKAVKKDCEGDRIFIRLLDYWLAKKFKNPNWWHNDIGTPQMLNEICLAMKKYLTEQQLKTADEIISIGSYRDNKAIDKWTGANLIWGTANTMYHAILNKDTELMKWAVGRSMEEVVIRDGRGEGIKPDMSFFQHGPLEYSFGYGRSYTNELTRILYVLSGSQFMPPKEKTDLFEKFVLDGSRYFTHGKYCDFMTVGREFSRLDNVKLGEYAFSIGLMLETKEFGRQEELRSYYEALTTGKKEKAKGLASFPNSHMIVQHTDKTYMSAKGVHKDYLCTEAGNKENYLAANFVDGGTVCFMADGGEYADISPMYDFTLIPGATSIDETDEEIAHHTNDFGAWFARYGRTDNCAQISEDGVAVLSMSFMHDPVRGHLTRVMADGSMIMCGNGISVRYDPSNITDPRDFYNIEGKNLKTAVDQARSMKFAGKEIIKEGKIAKNESAGNGGFYYTNLCETPMTAETVRVRGVWKRNDRELRDEVPDTEGDVFKVYFDHGKAECAENIGYAVCVTECGRESASDRVEMTDGCHVIYLRNGKKITVNYTEDTCEISINK